MGIILIAHFPDHYLFTEMLNHKTDTHTNNKSCSFLDILPENKMIVKCVRGLETFIFVVSTLNNIHFVSKLLVTCTCKHSVL